MSLSGQNRISVAMCTYNGERFLPEQLDSIARQTRLPDEVVVCDDGSTDSTMDVVRGFAASASYPIRIFVNERNLGFAANFEGAIRRCAGDLIALSDQDDVWHPTRLERSEQEFRAHPGAGMVFSDADLIDEQSQPLGETLWRRFGFDEKQRSALSAGQFTVLAKHRFVTGATLMFRAELRDRCLPIGAGWIHDEWMAIMLAAFSDLRAIKEPLIRYRIHGSQQVGFANKLEQRVQGKSRSERHWQRVAESANELQQVCDALSVMALDPGRVVLPMYQEHLEFLRFRSGLPTFRLARLGQVLSHSVQYGVHASGVASGLKDVVLKKDC